MKKLFALIFVTFAFLCVAATNTQAATTTPPVTLNYDLAVGQTQSMMTTDESGDPVELIVSEEPSMLRMANKTYTVSKNGIGWNVHYKVKVVSNRIISVGSLSAKATIGSFKSSSLQTLSATKAQWTAVHLSGFISTNVFCITTIKSGSLHIS